MRTNEYYYDHPLIQRIIEELDRYYALAQGNEWNIQAARTAGVYNALARAGRHFEYEIYAKIKEHLLPETLRHDYLKPKYGGWLFDVSMAEVNKDNSWLMTLVAECEWGVRNSIKEDFEKLIIARSKLRIIVYRVDRGVTHEDFYAWIKQHKNNENGDAYFLVGRQDDGWRYHLITWPDTAVPIT